MVWFIKEYFYIELDLYLVGESYDSLMQIKKFYYITSNKVISFFAGLGKTTIGKKLLERYKQRGISEDLINDAMYNFDNWSRNQNDYSYHIVVLQKDKYELNK